MWSEVKICSINDCGVETVMKHVVQLVKKVESREPNPSTSCIWKNCDRLSSASSISALTTGSRLLTENWQNQEKEKKTHCSGRDKF